VRALRVVLACVLAGAAGEAQQASQPVTLDLVLDAPEPMPLSVADIEVLESGRPVPVSAVRLQRPSGQAAPLAPIASDTDEQAAAAAADHLFGIYVDEYHLSAGASFERMRDALATALRSRLGPRDLLVVLKPLDSVTAIRLSADREQAAAVVQGAQPRRGDYAPRSEFERDFLAGAPARIDAQRNQIVTSGLDALIAHLAQFPGRKTLLVFSEGIPVPRAARRTASTQTGLAPLSLAANRGGIAVYGLMPAFNRPDPPTDDGPIQDAGNADALRALALGTTGLVIDEATAAPGLARMVADAHRYYLISVAPGDPEPDGRYRAVEVRVRRRGLTWRARGGFAVRPVAPPPREPLVKPLPAGLRVPRHSSALIRPWVGQSAADEGQTRVEFVWEPAPVRAGDRPSATAARIALTVSTMDDAPIFSGQVVPTGIEHIAPSPVPSRVTFTAAPATLLMRMEVLDLAGRVIDQDVRDLVVNRFSGPIALGTPTVFRARTERDLRLLRENDASAAPAASRQFSRTEHLVIRVPVSAPPDVVVTARLQNAMGGTLRSLDIERVHDSSPDRQIDLPLAAFASGAYTIEFTARAAGTVVVARMDFTVTP